MVPLGRTLTPTSLALPAGVFAPALASGKGIASFGLVSGVAILGSLRATRLVLPALAAEPRGAASGSRPAPP